jgi:hypothetical protein
MNGSRHLGGESGRKIRVDRHRDQLFAVHLHRLELPVRRNDLALQRTDLEPIRELDEVAREVLGGPATDASRTKGGQGARQLAKDILLEGVREDGLDDRVEDDALDGARVCVRVRDC